MIIMLLYIVFVILFRCDGFRTVYLNNQVPIFVNNRTILHTERSMKNAGTGPPRDEPSSEDILFYFNAYKCMKNLEMLGDSCKENIIIEKNVCNISLKSGGLYDDYDFPEF